jgi:carboxymethylenebutenolidase
MTNEQPSTAQPVPAHVAVPDAGAGPGVLVLHAWWGLNDFFKQFCDRLAAEGFVAVAPDLYGGKTATTIDEAQQLIQAMDGAAAEQRVNEAIAFLHNHPAARGSGLGVIGFSMGGAWALLTSTQRPDDIAAVVLFYASDAADFAQARAAYLGHYAEHDEWEPDEGIQFLENALRSAGRDVTFHTYPGTAHWFFENNRPEYNAEAAQLAWERTLAFLRERLITA